MISTGYWSPPSSRLRLRGLVQGHSKCGSWKVHRLFQVYSNINIETESKHCYNHPSACMNLFSSVSFLCYFTKASVCKESEIWKIRLWFLFFTRLRITRVIQDVSKILNWILDDSKLPDSQRIDWGNANAVSGGWKEPENKLSRLRVSRILWPFPLSLIRPIFKNVFLFNWRIIALQCCVGFCQTSTWISHRCTYVPTPLNLSPTAHSIPPL